MRPGIVRPMPSGPLAEVFGPLAASPRQAGIFTDFDGTLSEIVDDPDSARPVEGAADVLDELARRYRRVGIISGRPVAFLQRHFPTSLMLSGLYGLEVSDRGARTDHPSGGAWREVVDDVASASEARGPAGVRVERKGLSLTLHFRQRPEIEADVRAWAERQAARSGLELRAARMSFELHPPVDADKGTAIAAAARGLRSLCFLGDDLGDLPVFDTLDRLAKEGLHTVRVGVVSSEAPAELLDRADLVVDGPDGALGLLRSL